MRALRYRQLKQVPQVHPAGSYQGWCQWKAPTPATCQAWLRACCGEVGGGSSAPAGGIMDSQHNQCASLMCPPGVLRWSEREKLQPAVESPLEAGHPAHTRCTILHSRYIFPSLLLLSSVLTNSKTAMLPIL